MVFATDGKGSAVEITPFDTVLIPGEGLPSEENFDENVRTEEYEAKFVQTDAPAQYVATHLNINTHLNEAEVKAIGELEGWRVLTCNRDKGLFQLIEFWIEDRFMLEIMTPEQTARYVEITNSDFIAQAFQETFQMPLPPPTVAPSNLNLIG